jgi:hypothetical protein
VNDPKRGDLNEPARQRLVPILQRLVDELDLDDEGIQLASVALTDALIAGVRLGAAEVAAQALEGGLDLSLHLQARDASDDEDDETTP